jgi:hypothetical protein
VHVLVFHGACVGDVVAAIVVYVWVALVFMWLCVAVCGLCGLAVLSDMLDHIHVSAYGSSSSLTAVGNVVLRNSNLIVVSPFDATVSVRVLSGVVTVFDVHHKQAAACVCT